jgi:hypothetical protein
VHLQGGAVRVRAFRGRRRASVYREHVVAARIAARIAEVGQARGLLALSSLARSGRRELDKANARRLADEATELRMSGERPDLDHDLTGVAEVARWCARASGSSWLWIEGT